MALLSRWGLRRRRPRPARSETIGFASPILLGVAFPAGVVSAPIDATSAPLPIIFTQPAGVIGNPIAATSAPLVIGLVAPSSSADHPFAAIANPLAIPFVLPAGAAQFGNAYEQAVLADGPVTLWRMDEASGNLVDGISGKTAVPSGAPAYRGTTTLVPTKVTVELPTASDFFTAADHADHDLGDGPFTIEIIAGRVVDTGTWQTALHKGSTSYAIDVSAQDQWMIGKSGVAILARATAVAPSDGTLQHVVITRSATRGAGSTRVYVNGADVTFEESGALSQVLSDTADALEIGRMGAPNPSRMRMQYLAIYKSLLAPARVTAHWDALQQTVPPTLPIGGDQSLRGPKAYTLLTPTATVASPYGLTQVNAAIAAAGNGGTVRFPAAGSPYNFGFTLNQPNQRIQLETAATQVAGTVTLAASGVTFEGGRVHRFLATRAAIAQTVTIRHVAINGSGYGIEMQGSHHGWVVTNCEFTNQDLDFIKLWYDQVADPDLQGFKLKDSILVRSVAVGQRSGIGGQDGGSVNKIFDFIVTNCYFDFGSGINWYGIEVWNCETSPTSGKGGIVEYCDLRAGNGFLMSMVRSRDNWVHRNIFRVNGSTRSVYECAGPTHVRGVFEYNQVIGASNHAELGVISVNTNPTGFIVRNNKVSDMVWLVEGWATGGGGFTVRDNCITNVTNIIQPNAMWGVPNDVGNNTGTACGF